MNRYENYWLTTFFRGVLALLFGCALLVIPQMTSSPLLLPFGVVLAFLILAIYGAADSVIVFFTSFTIPQQSGRIASRLQGMAGIVSSLLLVTLVFDHVRMHWFFYLIAAQAFSIAFTDFLIARHTSRHHQTRWVYASCAVSTFATAIYLFVATTMAQDLSIATLARFIYSYLLAFGTSQVVLAIIMLSKEHSAHHKRSSVNGLTVSLHP